VSADEAPDARQQAEDAVTDSTATDSTDAPPDERLPVETEHVSLLPKPLLAVAIGLPVLLVAGVAAVGLVLGASGTSDPAAPSADRAGPLGLVSVPAPAAGSPECADLVSTLPVSLLSNEVVLERREIAEPAPVGAVAWGSAERDPVVLRCGLDRPGELTPTSALRVVSDVQWLQVEGEGASTWYAVDRVVYVALTVPDDAGTGPLQDVSTALRDRLASRPVDTGGS
jgi:hypothetical protein